MKFISYVFACTAFLLITSCGGGEEKKADKPEVKIGTQNTSNEKNDNSVTVGLTGNDLMQFSKKEIKVKAGQEVTLNFKHEGKMELVVMGHNFVLLKQGVDRVAFAVEAGAAGKPKDWIPNNGKDVIAHTKMLGGGQSTSITFTAPAAGTYEYICSFPGHAGLMRGNFIVE